MNFYRATTQIKPISIQLLLILAVNGCASSATSTSTVTANQTITEPASELQFSNVQHAVTKLSEDKYYRATLYSQSYPIPLGKIHNWLLHVETADGKPLENVKIYVHGGMPQHQHGFPTNPRIKQYLGNGNYLVEGVKFSMLGSWEIRFNIKQTSKRDRVIFNVNL